MKVIRLIISQPPSFHEIHKAIIPYLLQYYDITDGPAGHMSLIIWGCEGGLNIARQETGARPTILWCDQCWDNMNPGQNLYMKYYKRVLGTKLFIIGTTQRDKAILERHGLVVHDIVKRPLNAVSYTHLTLPTTERV